MNMGENDLKRFSKEFARVLDDIGVNEEMVSLRRHVSLLMDKYWSLFTFKHFTFGSQSEGSTTMGMRSDTDTLLYFDTDVACVHMSDIQDSKTNYVVIKEPMSLPQCCCLQLVGRLENNIYLPMRIDLISNTESIGLKFLIDKQDRLLLNSRFYLNLFLCTWDNLKISILQQHGPAYTLYNKCTVQDKCTLHDSYTDTVFAVRCMTLPDQCKVLFTRPRPGHWPTQETLSKAEQCEVYMVHPGVLRHTFAYDDKRRFSCIKLQYQHTFVDSQFRISTNMIERLLMFDLNIVQMKAYVITKMIRKEFLQPLVDERLSTFHMKTALLFTIEQFPEEIWSDDDNILQCVTYCLNTLNRFLKKGYCPHYTVSSVNLFAEKLTKKDLQIVKEKVTEMLKSGLRCIRKLCMDDVCWRLSASSVVLRNDNILSRREIRYMIIIQVMIRFRHEHEEHILRTFNNLKKEALAIKSAMVTDHECKNELEFIFQSMCSTIASREASDCIANGRKVTRDIIDMYEISLKSKDVSNHLRYVSMLVSTRQFKRARALLETIEKMIESNSIQLKEFIKKSINVKSKSDEIPNKLSPREIFIQFSAIMQFPVNYDVSEINCVPGDLKYEKYRVITKDKIKYEESTEHAFTSDAQPFLLYMQYISYKNNVKKRIALQKLSDYCDIELQNKLSDHLDSKYNMLGHVIELENNLQNTRRERLATALINMLGNVFEFENSLLGAWKRYRQSVAIQPHNNLAYWHLFRFLGYVVYS
ncbi:hypothetical protein DPMN_089496 [Dreissena polymorpha]|uniref:Mab-21-like HhH/H2TH-like domain-containing protein n=1 Tax=Dreissena polymorpha TaxID=45954 RepID=A0A9D4KWW9_DREPO|nr:hypothetical protein DPMN_089496 [Dreissena polymorpha]